MKPSGSTGPTMPDLEELQRLAALRAKGFALPVPVGGTAVMFVPNPMADPHIEWSLRYAGDLNDSHAGRFSAAAIVEGYAYLLSREINMTEATRRLRVLRAALRTALEELK